MARYTADYKGGWIYLYNIERLKICSYRKKDQNHNELRESSNSHSSMCFSAFPQGKIIHPHPTEGSQVWPSGLL